MDEDFRKAMNALVGGTVVAVGFKDSGRRVEGLLVRTAAGEYKRLVMDELDVFDAQGPAGVPETPDSRDA